MLRYSLSPVGVGVIQFAPSNRSQPMPVTDRKVYNSKIRTKQNARASSCWRDAHWVGSSHPQARKADVYPGSMWGGS